MPLSKDKKALRRFHLAVRRGLTVKYKSESDISICRQVILTEEYKRAETILAYASTDIEVDTRQLIAKALSDGKQVGLPRVDGKNMIFHKITSLSQLCKGYRGIEEPSPELEIIDSPPKNSVCIVPALSVDQHGFRLGYGGGFYDRYLNSVQLFKLCICYGLDLCDSLPHELFDICVDAVITEQGLLRYGDGRIH